MEVKTSLDERMQKELLKTPIICCWIIIIFGGISLILTIVTAIGAKKVDGIFLLATAIFLIMGIVLLISLNKTIQSFQKTNRENVYTFYDEYVEVKTMYHDEVSGSSKLYYSDIFKVKETKSFIFIYLNPQQAFPILKENVSDLDYLKKLIKKK